MSAAQFARDRLILCAVCLLGAVWYGESLFAEEARRPELGLYDGAVGIKLDEIAQKSITRVNPETMENAPWPLVKARIEQMTGMQVWVDESALADAGIEVNEETVLPQWLAGETVTTLATQLTQQLFNTPLALFVQDGVLTLATEEKANENYVTRQYPIGDLLSEECDPEAIILILEQTTPGPWDADEPGTGTLSMVGHLLFVRQTHRMHQAVAEVLAGLRHKEPIVLTNCSAEDLRLRRLLEEQRISYEFPDNTLQEIVDRLQVETGVKFRLDQHALNDAGLDNDTRVNARAANLPLYVALQQMLGNVNGTALTVHVSNEECLITTAERANEMYETVLYRVGPLGMTGERLHDFVGMLEQETSGPWNADEPGTGTIAGIAPRSILVVWQTQRVHREILEILRGLRAESPATPVAPRATTSPTTSPSFAHVAHPVFTKVSAITQSIRQQFAAVTWGSAQDYAPLLLALLLGCVTGYYCRH